MSEEVTYTERYEDEDGKVKYVRDFGDHRVEVYLTHDYLKQTDQRIIESYLNNVVGAILERHNAS